MFRYAIKSTSHFFKTFFWLTNNIFSICPLQYKKVGFCVFFSHSSNFFMLFSLFSPLCIVLILLDILVLLLFFFVLLCLRCFIFNTCAYVLCSRCFISKACAYGFMLAMFHFQCLHSQCCAHSALSSTHAFNS